jgi:hypothetical protein
MEKLQNLPEKNRSKLVIFKLKFISSKHNQREKRIHSSPNFIQKNIQIFRKMIKKKSE